MRIPKGCERLNVLLVGASSLGKTSFLSTLGQTSLTQEGEFSEHKLMVENQPVYFYEARGYGTTGDMAESFAKIEGFVRERYREHLVEETKIHRDVFFEDKRIHLVLVFLSVNNRGIKDYDLTLLKLLHTKTNLILVIPKCDYHTETELSDLRAKISSCLSENKIDLFETNEIPKEKQPLALLAADKKSIDGKPFSGRELPCGRVLISNPEHSDFELFTMLLTSARADLLSTTHFHFYEKYRIAMLQ
ncbi:hypothetical protein NEHOM01_1142 [Nematocida homosporus]|uniref:uncharacterized protein n=1 Tax=Nematocida homosporus TaxID=1912981 RepID=UPI00221F05A0|nr:uncharacterized protein NEHOM01_1142 [Nematocida homosporus]KAI5185892.1 hypothetical protein NEHOM01_1142 [Nematocida homosporus]